MKNKYLLTQTEVLRPEEALGKRQSAGVSEIRELESAIVETRPTAFGVGGRIPEQLELLERVCV